MDFHVAGGSPSSSSTTSSSDPNPSRHHHHHNRNGDHHHDNGHNNSNSNDDPMQSWWESVSKARHRIHLLSSLLPPTADSSLSSLADSDRPARSLLSFPAAYSAVSSFLSSPSSGSGADPLCNWLYDTFLSSDPDLRLVVLSFIPLLSSLYLSRIHSPTSPSASLAGFEAVLLALYAAETKSRAGKPLLVNIPDLSQPSLYHSPRVNPNTRSNPGSTASSNTSRPSVGVLSPPLEPQVAVKSTKRACIVGVALDCYYKQISQMPSWSKLDFCRFAADWAGQDCPCKSEFDSIDIDTFSNGIHIEEVEDVVEEMRNLEIEEDAAGGSAKGVRIPLPWELLQPVLRILGHCLLAPLNVDDVKDSAAVAVRCLYARASHELVPQAILATRSLIQLDKRTREVAAAAAAAAANVASNTNTPSKAKKPEILLGDIRIKNLRIFYKALEIIMENMEIFVVDEVQKPYGCALAGRSGFGDSLGNEKVFGSAHRVYASWCIRLDFVLVNGQGLNLVWKFLFIVEILGSIWQVLQHVPTKIGTKMQG
ncbi:hypothetical protein RJ640_009053 [Escallonia rubra]|uniref:Hyccin n=1 Tax=Escallonia rubra TaxID=112253 RepID=A0AA88UJ34_9ASTE|nr:hypothetical protein RJ640_009053 [Escallonia rubra]